MSTSLTIALLAASLSPALGQPPAPTDPEDTDPGTVSVALSSDAILRLGGYLDVGWFDAQGDGVSYAHTNSPGPRVYGTAWAFTGDPWANMVNSLGDPADLGTDYVTTLDRADPIDSNGNPTFVVNQYHQSVGVGVGERLAIRTAVDLAPRSGDLGSLGDVLWMDYGYLEFLPGKYSDWRITAGKIESPFGAEYRYRQAPSRYGITPSMLARYTTGTPVGIKARGSIRQVVWLTAAITNDSTATERFGHFAHDIDDNGSPTGTTHVAVRKTGGDLFFEVGGSAQAGYRGDDAITSMFGGDLTVKAWLLELKAEILRARYPRSSADQDLLVADAWQLELSALPTPILRPLARLDYREAVLATGPNIYLSDVLRTTVGFRVSMSTHASFKAEYLHLDEIGSPEIRDDVFTTSALVEF